MGLLQSCPVDSAPLVGRSTSVVEHRSTNMTTCEECCSSDYCNRNGCGSNEIPFSQRGPYCFTCDVLNPKTDCNDVDICAADEMCVLYAPPEFSGLPETIYRGRCETKTGCYTLGQTSNNDNCLTMCCDTDFCNDRCQTPTNTTIATTPATTSQTSAPSTKGIHTERITHITTLATSTHGHCNTSDGFEYVHNAHAQMCVYFVQNHSHKTWDYARHRCQIINSELVVLDTHAKAALIRKYIIRHTRLHTDMYWVGARDFNNHDHFSWVNGNAVHVNTNDWDNHQPDTTGHGHDKDCVCIHRGDDHSYTWHNKECNDKGFFICER
ncbi:uncharacterized protein LOC132722157 isoform X2 [Ruditapes philippinarum]|uniref:uncharacterized protein LOC132722157 isoform X2 n=1 Tax=Ruditapes philippinarum TaxID=129788 RepID=UPI00295A906A|nr:uncharacterized protein LOC132722157 isoform X2 [Ruditapes philippinarum]